MAAFSGAALMNSWGGATECCLKGGWRDTFRRSSQSRLDCSFRHRNKGYAAHQQTSDKIKSKAFRIHWRGPSRALNYGHVFIVQSSRWSEVDDTKTSASEGVQIRVKRSKSFDESKTQRHSLDESTSEFASSKEGPPVLLDETFTAVVAGAAEIVAETVEVAAQTVSTVGEIETSIPDEFVIDKGSAIKTVAFWVTAALGFGMIIGINEGFGKASEFFAGYLLEQSLSIDNLFVFVLIFNYFQVPLSYQSRVLTYGVSGAIIFRAIMILLGVITLQNYEALNLLFASILLFSSYKLFMKAEDEEEDLSSNFVVNVCKKFIPVTSEYDGSKFFTSIDGVRKATPLLLTLAVVECSDIAFAVDSIPAVFGVTRDPFIVFSSNIFAILGLRSLYTLISSSMYELKYLQPAVGAVLGFIGSKMIVDYFGYHVSTEVSLGVVALILATGTTLSLLPPPERS